MLPNGAAVVDPQVLCRGESRPAGLPRKQHSASGKQQGGRRQRYRRDPRVEDQIVDSAAALTVLHSSTAVLGGARCEDRIEAEGDVRRLRRCAGGRNARVSRRIAPVSSPT